MSYEASLRYVRKVPSKGVYLPNRSTSGFGKYLAHQGDIVVFRQSETHTTIGRVLGIVTHDGTGSEYRVATGRGKQTKRAPRLLVLGTNDSLSFAYLRHVAPSDVEECRAAPDARFIAWLLAGEMPKVETIVAASNYGALNDRAFAKYAPDGTLRDSWRDVDKVQG